MFIGLNPSTADALQDDPTIRRCISFSRGFQYGGFDMLNLFAYRSTEPDNLVLARDPVGPLNITAILSAAQRCSICIVAWGAINKTCRKALDYDRRALATLGLILNSGHHPVVYCLGVTKEGFPSHPLFLKGTTPLQVYTNPRLDKHNADIAKRRRNDTARRS